MPLTDKQIEAHRRRRAQIAGASTVTACILDPEVKIAQLLKDYPELADLVDESRVSIHGNVLKCQPEDRELVITILELI